MQILSEIEQQAFQQDYSKKGSIEGVKTIALKRFNDDGGAFTELARLSEGCLQSEFPLSIRQINYSIMETGALKAFHFHRRQTDVWFVPPEDKVLLILVDLRVDSPTQGLMQRMVLGDCKSELVFIPPGIAHGCKNLADHQSRIMYFIDQQFNPDPAECDEWRLPWDHFGAGIWDIQRG